MTEELAVLVGNGLSMAFNPELGLRDITQAMLARIESEADEGDAATAAMKAVAERALPTGVTSDSDFEILVGAFGTEQRTLTFLSQLAAALDPSDTDLTDAIAKTVAFAERVRDMGISHVLEVIFERSYARTDLSAGLYTFLGAVMEGFDGRITFGNLNYDTLLLAGLLEIGKEDLADLGHGYRQVIVTTESGRHPVPALRRSPDFPADRRVRLLQLHGSLTFWTHRESDIFMKLDTNFLRTESVWRQVRDGGVEVRPVVVLANQQDKSAHVEEYPFSLAYSAFREQLSRSDRWLVVGYSFRDACVNQMLQDEFLRREEGRKPQLLVVTLGSVPTLDEIEKALGWGAEDGSSSSWLSVSRDGAEVMSQSLAWAAFLSKLPGSGCHG